MQEKDAACLPERDSIKLCFITLCHLYLIPPQFSSHYEFVSCNLLSNIPAGINPTALRGTDTGVWVGASGSEAAEALSQDPEELLGYSMTGCQRAMLANRISYFYDFTGKCPQTCQYLLISNCSFSMVVQLLLWGSGRDVVTQTPLG